MRRRLIAIREWLKRWDKLFTVGGSAVSMLLSLSAIFISLFTLARTSLLARPELAVHVGGFHLVAFATAGRHVLEVPGDTFVIGGESYKAAPSEHLMDILRSKDIDPLHPGPNIVLTSDNAPDLLYALVRDDVMRKKGSVTANSIGHARVPVEPEVIARRAFFDALRKHEVEEFYPALRAALDTLASVQIPAVSTTMPLLVTNTGDKLAVLTGLQLRIGVHEWQADGTSRNVGLIDWTSTEYVEIEDPAPAEMPQLETPVAVRAGESVRLVAFMDAPDAADVARLASEHREALDAGRLVAVTDVKLSYQDGERSREMVGSASLNVTRPAGFGGKERLGVQAFILQPYGYEAFEPGAPGVLGDWKWGLGFMLGIALLATLAMLLRRRKPDAGMESH